MIADEKLIGGDHLVGVVFSSGWTRHAAVADVVEPATGVVLGQIGIAKPDDVAVAATAARAAQVDWAAGLPDGRAAVFLEAVRVAAQYRDEIIEWIMRESGSVRAKAEFELAITSKAMQLAAAMPHQAQGLVLPSERGRISLARRCPLGVVGVIAPFNFPLYLAMRAIAPALAVGNGVILKPDPRTTICGGFVIARIFELAGLPPGLLHVLPGGGDAGEALCRDDNVAMIQFTGSTAAGRVVGRTAGQHLKKVSLELGGKNSLIILEDADLDLAARNAAWASYLHQGQICMSAGRILVQAGIAEEFSRRLATRAEALPVGDPMSETVAVGPIINRSQLDHAQKVVGDSVAAGATLIAGGDANELFLKPAVLTGVTRGMAAFREEIFGPVAVIVPFETDADAIALANDTEYGLSAGIITSDVARGLALGEKIRAGLIHINDQTVNDDVVNPFGGVGASGNGTSIGGPANWEEFTHWQWTTLKSAAPPYPF